MILYPCCSLILMLTFNLIAVDVSAGDCRGAGSYLSESEVTERVLNVIQKFDKVDAGKLSPTAHFKQDLGLDSLDETEVVMAFEEEFSVDIPDAEADKIKSVKDAINFITAEPNAK